MSVSKRLVRVLCLVIPILFVSGYWASAAIFVVTTTSDSLYPGSLRAAIIAANRSRGNSVIRLGASRGGSTYRLTISGADEDSARTGDLDITRGNVTIIGVGSGVTIDATGLGDRVFQVFSNAHLTLENLIIKDGSAPSGSGFWDDGEAGGAIYNAGNLTLVHCIITNNTSGPGQPVEGNGGGTGGGDGGGIYNSGMLSANNCQFVGNASGPGFDGAGGGNGGGIRNDGTCLLTECIISANQAGAGGGPMENAVGFGGGGGIGGGICNAGKMTLRNCIVSTNSAGAGASGGQPSGSISLYFPGGFGGSGGVGGAIYNAGKMELDFSSVYNNNAGNGGNGGSFGGGGNAGVGGDGGGIFNFGEVDLNTCTISSNSAGNGGAGGDAFTLEAAPGGAGGSGGGICNTMGNQPYSGSLVLTSCTVAANTSGAGGNGGVSSTEFSLYSGPPPSGGPGGSGGGIWNSTTNALARNTLIALNLANAGGFGGITTNYSIAGTLTNSWPPPPTVTVGEDGTNGIGSDVAGDFVSQGFNLIGTGGGSTGFTNGISADQIGTDSSPINPLLGPLQMNGGPTPTQALLPGSPAIDQGNSFGVHFDQRRAKRPHDLSTITNAPGGDGSDIGAFEF